MYICSYNVYCVQCTYTKGHREVFYRTRKGFYNIFWDFILWSNFRKRIKWVTFHHSHSYFVVAFRLLRKLILSLQKSMRRNVSVYVNIRNISRDTFKLMFFTYIWANIMKLFLPFTYSKYIHQVACLWVCTNF